MRPVFSTFTAAMQNDSKLTADFDAAEAWANVKPPWQKQSTPLAE
jgi:hypothetical protein